MRFLLTTAWIGRTDLDQNVLVLFSTRVTGPHPDRVPMIVRRAKCESVADMIRHGWNVIAVCRACRVKINVDLRVIAKVRGARFSLWNRAARCRCVGCTGFVDFLARAPDGMTTHQPLASPYPDDG